MNKKLSSNHEDNYSKQPPIATTTTSFYLDWGLRKGKSAILITAHHNHLIGHIMSPVIRCKDLVIQDKDHGMIPEMAVAMAIPSHQVHNYYVMLIIVIICLQWISKYGRKAIQMELNNYMVTSNGKITCKKIFHLANKKVTVSINQQDLFPSGILQVL